MSQKTLEILERKAEEFERNKKSSIDEMTRRIGELTDLLQEIESALARKAEARFGENPFAEAYSMLGDDATPASIAKAEEVSRMPVLAPIYPEDEELQSTKAALQRLLNVVKPIPKNLCARAEPTGKVTLTWDRATNASGYRAEMRAPGEKAFREIYRGSGTSTTTRGLVCSNDEGEGKEYQMRVCALYEGEESGWSDAVSVRPWCLVPPKGVSATSDASDAIRVTWDGAGVAGGRAVSYKVEICAPSFAKTYVSDKPFLSEKGFEPLKEYSVRVCSVLGREESAWSSPSVTVKTQCPRCLMGHDLTPYIVSEICSRYRFSQIACDICQKTFSRDYKGTLYGCRVCNCDLCPECVKTFKRTTTMKCKNGHSLALVPLGLRLSGKPYSCVICDICGKNGITCRTCSSNYPILHCHACDYDVCPECAAKYK